METVLLLSRNGTGKTTCIANQMQADHRVAAGTSQFFVARSRRICHLVASLHGTGVQAEDSLNMHSLTLHDVVYRVTKSLGLADSAPWNCKELCVCYLQLSSSATCFLMCSLRDAEQV
jgi:hypothetical protein